jgi:hypothetical protein
MSKTYSVNILRDGKISSQPMEFSSRDSRANLAGAMVFAEAYAKRGLHIQVVYAKEIIWDSRKDLTTSTK